MPQGLDRMKIKYIKKIHVGEERFNNTKERIQFSLIHGEHNSILQYCCDGAKTGFFEIAYDKRSFQHLKYEERQEPLDKPLICMMSYELGFCGDEAEIKLIPINYCPFCGGKNKIEHIKTILVEHKYKLVKKKYDEKEWYMEEKVIE